MGKLIPIDRKRRQEGQAEAQRRWLEVNEVLQGTPWDWPKATFLQTRLRFLRGQSVIHDKAEDRYLETGKRPGE